MLKVGESVEVGLLRDGKPKRLTAVLREPAQLADASAIHPALAGADLVEAAEGSGSGVIIKSVQPDSPAAQAGLRAEDRIVAVNRTRISSLAQLREVTKDQTSVLLQLQRGNQALILPLR